MSKDVIVLGENFEPPVVNMETTQDIYDCVRADEFDVATDEFDVATFNSLLMAIVTYLDAHNVKYADKALPWAELIKSC